jgi:CheY-like chemotaxis protein
MAQSAPAPLRLLLVEDAEIDAELVMDELNDAGMRFDLLRIQDEPTFRAALGEMRPDAILSDWTLPGFSGRAALQIARALYPEVPFIFVAGTLPLAAAREMLRHGAVDYVFKNHLVMLPLVLTRALEEAARQAEILNRLRRTDAQRRIAQLADELPEPEFLTASLDLIESLADSRMAFLHIEDDDPNIPPLLACSTQARQDCGTIDLASCFRSLAGGWAADAVRLQRPIILNDYANNAPVPGLPQARMDVERVLCVPIIANGRVQATLSVSNRSADYGSFDVETLELLGRELWRIVQIARGTEALHATVARLREDNQQIQSAQDQLVQSARVSALGQLAAGIANELNAPLACVKSNLGGLGKCIDGLLAIVEAYRGGADAQEIERREKLDSIGIDAPASIAEMLAAVDKAQCLALQLKDFSRQQGGQEWQWAELDQAASVKESTP